jgi:hypothetical protein
MKCIRTCFLVLACLGGAAARQETRQPLVGRIKGVILDSTGKPVAEAGLKLTNLDTGTVRESGSDAAGVFQFMDLPPGHYTMLVRKSGYRDYAIRNVTVRPGEDIDLPGIGMTPGSSGRLHRTVVPRTSP